MQGGALQGALGVGRGPAKRTGLKSKKDIFEKRKRRGERIYLRCAEIHPFNPKRIEKRAKAMRKRPFGRAKARSAPGRAPNIPKRDNIRKSCRFTNRR